MEIRFRAMGTDVHLIASGAPQSALDEARGLIVDLEARWSRFRPDGEVSRLNASAGFPALVSEETFLLVERGVEGWKATGGRFDPTVLAGLVAAGYDRSFELLEPPDRSARPARRLRQTRSPARRSGNDRAGCQGIALDPVLRAVTLPRGVGFDPGGIGKGLAADLVVGTLIDAGAAGACANLGGDLRAEGEAPGGGPWAIEVEHPFGGEEARLCLEAGAVATTSRTRRVWQQDGRARHHLIDPGTGLPATTGLASITVVAGEAWWAEVAAKAAYLAGSEALQVLHEMGTTGLAIDDDGRVLLARGWEEFAA